MYARPTKYRSCIVDEDFLAMQSLPVRHALEDDLSPHAHDKFDGFFFQYLSMKDLVKLKVCNGADVQVLDPRQVSEDLCDP